jgi:hypothetical protein
MNKKIHYATLIFTLIAVSLACSVQLTDDLVVESRSVDQTDEPAPTQVVVVEPDVIEETAPEPVVEEVIDEPEPVEAEPAPLANTDFPTRAQVLEDCSGDFDVSPYEDPLVIEVDGTIAIMYGLLDPGAYDEVVYLLDNHPEVRTIVMTYVPGSDDNGEYLDAALLVNEANLATCVPDGGEIASGAVDFFLAGVVRVLGDNTFVGIHAWAGDDLEAGELARDDPEHDVYLNFFRQIGIDEDFYWFTLEAAPSWDIYNMSEIDRQDWDMETP